MLYFQLYNMISLYIFICILFPYRLLQNTKFSFLCSNSLLSLNNLKFNLSPYLFSKMKNTLVEKKNNLEEKEFP